jgi:hypothetical protein
MRPGRWGIAVLLAATSTRVLAQETGDPADSAECATFLAAPAAAGGDAAERFRSCLAGAGAGMTAEERAEALANEATSIQDKLRAIAAQWQEEPDRYREIETWYALDERGLIPWLSSRHAVEEYRLVWEYLVLRPHSIQGGRGAEALGVIGNPHSVVTLRRAYKSSDAGRRFIILSGLAEIPCREAADAITEVLQEAGGQGDPTSTEPAEWPQP